MNLRTPPSFEEATSCIEQDRPDAFKSGWINTVQAQCSWLYCYLVGLWQTICVQWQKYRQARQAIQLGVIGNKANIIPPEKMPSLFAPLYIATETEWHNLKMPARNDEIFPVLFRLDQLRQCYHLMSKKHNEQALACFPTTSSYRGLPSLPSSGEFVTDEYFKSMDGLTRKRMLNHMLHHYCQGDKHWLWELGQLLNQRTIFVVLMALDLQWKNAPLLNSTSFAKCYHSQFRWSLQPSSLDPDCLVVQLHQWWQPRVNEDNSIYAGEFTTDPLDDLELCTTFYSWKPAANMRQQASPSPRILQHVQVVDCRIKQL